MSCVPSWLVSFGVLAQVAVAAADILPPERRTTWNPGIPGGVPDRATVCATVNAASYGNGASDATAGIQSAIDACPAGQVVQLSAGDFLVNGAQPIRINKGIVLRGAGPVATKLRKTSTAANPLIVLGERWLQEAASVNLTANAAKGATSVQVSSTAGFSVGQLVVLDELTDTSYVYWGIDPAVAPGGVGRGWFTRYDRPIGQMLEIASLTATTVSFTTPLHIAFDTAHTAQLTRYTIPYGAKYAGIEDLYVRGGQDDNITLRFALYSWVKNVESDWSLGDSLALDSCFRCVLRDSYVHDTPNPYPGGDGYMLSLARYTADSLVENNIFINGNKVMVMRASGGGNVIGYNYFDNGYIGNFLGWMETGLNASHLTCPHFELFEGNQAFNIDGDDTWGGAVYNTFFRNHATGKRRSYPDTSSRRAIGLMYGHYYYSFVGNILGTPDQVPAPFGGFAYEDLWPWEDDPVGLWRIGYTPTDWDAQPDARVVATTHRHGNFDYATNSVRWTAGFDQTLPASLYLTSKPAFFGDAPWPWVDPTGATKLRTLPARARYDAGSPIPLNYTLTIGKTGTGGGTVSSTPAGINCGATCSASYLAGTPVTLLAAPAAGATFIGWSGACSGTGSCTTTMAGSRAVSARFGLAAPRAALVHVRTDRSTLLFVPHLSNLAGSFATQTAYSTGWHYNGLEPTLVKVLSADVNGDGRDDLVHVRTDHAGLLFIPHLADGAGGYQRGALYFTGWHYNGLEPTLADVVPADLNGDGRIDLVHVRTDHGLIFFVAHLSDGAGGFQRQAPYFTSWHYNGGEQTLVKVIPADVNGDGRVDLVHVRTNLNTLMFIPHLSNGAGGFTAQPAYSAGWHYNGGEPTYADVLPADLNGDGRMDLVHVRTDHNVLLFIAHLSNGAGGFTRQPVYSTGLHYNGGEATFVNVLPADLNGDGRTDLVHVRTNLNTLMFVSHLSNGTGGFTGQAAYSTGWHYNGAEPTYVNVLPADLDGNGRMDLVHVRTDHGLVMFVSHLSDGMGGFQRRPPYFTGWHYSGAELTMFGVLSALH